MYVQSSVVVRQHDILSCSKTPPWSPLPDAGDDADVNGADVLMDVVIPFTRAGDDAVESRSPPTGTAAGAVTRRASASIDLLHTANLCCPATKTSKFNHAVLGYLVLN
eukprot:SAG11_NODE_15228_length_584_cov_1.767010_1_plen_108_part_00